MVTARRTGTNEDCRNDADTAFLGRAGTYGTASRDFSALANWEVDNDRDLVADDKSLVLEAFDDETSFDDSINMAGSTTSSTLFRILRAASGEGHDGTSNNGVHFASTTDMASVAHFQLNETNVHCQDLIVSIAVNSANLNVGFGIIADTFMIGMIGFDFINNGSSVARGMNLTGTAILCLIENCENQAFLLATDSVMYNCIAIGNALTGFFDNGSTQSVKNCLSDGNTTDFGSFSGATLDSNASGDTTASGTGARISQTFTFVNASGNDYHLDTGDSGARNFGTDLSGDATFAFDDDIDFELFDTWDIGFDESQVAAGGLSIPVAMASYRRRRAMHNVS